MGASVRYRVLGPLELRDGGGRLVRLGAPKQRTLLGLLLLHANQPVGVERLIEALWEARPPASAAGVLRTYLSWLRRGLGLRGRGGTAQVVAEPGAYRLVVPVEQVDLLLFQELAAQGEQALAAGDVELAAGRLERAVELWRGRAFEDVGLDGVAAAELAQLQERRLGTVEGWVEARLALGQHQRVLERLAGVVTQEPLRERLWAGWMLALYRSGRQAEALAAFGELRGRLVQELGIDPSPPLQQLHRQILSADPALSPPAAPASPGGPVRVPASFQAVAVAPRQLPADVATFTGRERELAQLVDALGAVDRSGPVVISALQGAGGIGKSALAIHAAHQMADRFPDGQLYIDLQGATDGLSPLEPLEVLGRFLRALGMELAEIPTDLEEAGGAFRSRVAGRRLLVVLDNARDAAQVRPLVPATSGCMVLVTSRRLLASLDGASHLHLDILPSTDAVQLLGRLAGEQRVAREPEPAAEVARWCGWLPLALRIAGARLAARPAWPVGTLAERLADAQRRLDELELTDVGVRASFAVSYQELVSSADPLDRAAARAFGLLGLLDGADVGVPVVARLLAQPEDDSERVLERLVDAQLLETPSPGRYRLHDLLRLYAREHAVRQHSERERSAALTRAFSLYVATTWHTLELLRPGDYRLDHADDRWSKGGLEFAGTMEALEWLEAERANLIAAIQQAAAPGVPSEIAVQLAQGLFGFISVRRHRADLVRVNQAALGAARQLGDRAAQAQAYHDLGLGYWGRGQVADALACLRESLEMFRELGDRRGQAAGQHNLGFVYERHGCLEEALACLRESLEMFRELGDRRGQAAGQHTLAQAYGRQGRLEEALACLRESLEMFRELGDVHAHAECLRDLGVTLRALGRPEEAQAQWQQALALFEQLQATEVDQVRALLAGETPPGPAS